MDFHKLTIKQAFLTISHQQTPSFSITGLFYAEAYCDIHCVRENLDVLHPIHRYKIEGDCSSGQFILPNWRTKNILQMHQVLHNIEKRDLCTKLLTSVERWSTVVYAADGVSPSIRYRMCKKNTGIVLKWNKIIFWPGAVHFKC